MNFKKLPDTHCICVSCVTLPGWDPCPCRTIFIDQSAENGGLDPSWLNLAFLGRPNFQSRAPKILVLKGLGTFGRKIGVPQKRQIQRRIQPPILGPLKEGCGGLGGENPAAFPQARPIFQQPFSLPENAQTLAGIAFRAAGKSVKNFPTALKFAGKPFQQGISDSHSLLEFSD